MSIALAVIFAMALAVLYVKVYYPPKRGDVYLDKDGNCVVILDYGIGENGIPCVIYRPFKDKSHLLYILPLKTFHDTYIPDRAFDLGGIKAVLSPPTGGTKTKK